MKNSLLTLIVVFVCLTAAQGTTKYWTPAGGDGVSWGDPGNWDPAGVPTGPLDEVKIVGYASDTWPTISDDRTILRITMANPAATSEDPFKPTSMTIAPTGVLNFGTSVFGFRIVNPLGAHVYSSGNVDLMAGGVNGQTILGNDSTVVGGYGKLTINGGLWKTYAVYINNLVPNKVSEITLNDGTLYMANTFYNVVGYKGGVNISSAANAKIDHMYKATTGYQDAGLIVADSGWGTVIQTTVGGRTIYTARAYDPDIDIVHLGGVGNGWDNLGENAQSMDDFWNYTLNRRLWAGDQFVLRGTASYGVHPILESDLKIAYLQVGRQVTATGPAVNDVIEITSTGNLLIENGGIALGTNGTYQSGGPLYAKGTLLVNGGTVTCMGIGVGYGVPDSYLYGEGLVEMNGGLIDCNNIVLSVPDSAYPDEPFGIGTVRLNAGTINIRATHGLEGVEGSKGLNIKSGTLIIEGDMTNVNSVDYIEARALDGTLTAYDSNGVVIYDYDVTNTGKTTVQAYKIDLDNSGDFIGAGDLAVFADGWLVGTGDADINKDGDVNFKDFAILAQFYGTDLPAVLILN